MQKSDLDIEIRHRDHFEEAAKESEQLFRLVNEGRIPDQLLAWMVITKCLRVLRTIYGSDLETVSGLRDRVMQDEIRHAEMERKRR